MTEKQFQQAVVDLAHRLGWLVMGVGKVEAKRGGWRTNWIADGKGWPDLTFVKGERIVCAELKVGANKPEPDQKRWRDALRALPAVEYCLWFDSDWASGKIDAVLKGEA